MKKKNIYLGSGLDPLIFLILKPILEGYCLKEDYNIIVEKSDFDAFKKFIKQNNINNYLLELEKKFKIIDFDYRKINFTNLINLFSLLIKNFFFYLRLLFFFSYNDKKIYKTNFCHAYWDSCSRSSLVNQISPPTRIKLKVLLKLLITQIKAKELTKNNIIEVAFLGHSVYSYRLILDEFKKNRIKVFCQANYCFFKQTKNKDFEWSFVSKELFAKIKKKYSP